MAADTPILDRALELDPRVDLRPEPFGALAYHHGTRRLMFLRDPDVAALLTSLATSPTVGEAFEACAIAPERHRSFAAALASLLDAGVIRDRAG